MSAIVQYSPPSGLSRPLEWTPEQRKMIRDTYANGASDSEFSMLMSIASVRQLDPIKRQIWFVKRWDSMKRCEVWAPQTSIDGLRTIAQRTGLYDGQDEPEFVSEHKSGRLEFCRVKVYRKDWTRPAVGIAYWSEYAAKKKDGSVTQMWAEKPHVMIAKCAEALGLRKAFPEDTAGLYVAEEMPPQDAQEPRRELRAPPSPSPVARALPKTQASVRPAPAPSEEPPPCDPETGEIVEAEVSLAVPPAEQSPAFGRSDMLTEIAVASRAELPALARRMKAMSDGPEKIAVLNAINSRSSELRG